MLPRVCESGRLRRFHRMGLFALQPLQAPIARLASLALLAAFAACRGPGPMPAADRPPAPEKTAALPATASLALEGCRYDSARAMVEAYCADCHSSHGRSPARERARRGLSVDTYADWIGASREVPGRVDMDSLQDKIMPPHRFPAQPSAAERKLLVDWVRRGSPNTANGR